MNKKLVKNVGIILLSIVAVYVVLILIKKYANVSWLNWLPSPLAEQEHFRFEDLPMVEQNRQDGLVPMRPSLIAQVPPRFDPNQLASNLTAQSAAPLPMMAAPPSSSPLDAMTYDNVDFQELGGQAAPIPSGGLTTQQADDMLRDRVGSGKPEYFDTKELMPVADMRYTTGLDPTDPQNFMYDRTIFGRLKRRYGTEFDFLRGTLDIKPDNRGWFDLMPPSENDLVVGYFDRYIDIEQETAIKDASFTRATPVEDLYKSSINPGGKTFLTRYDHY